MPSTYTLIKGETLTSSSASYTFTAIPSTFTDLVLRYSTRGSDTSTQSNFIITVNGGASGYGVTNINGDGSAVASQRATSAGSISHRAGTNADSSTTNTFANGEIYIPNYALTVAKPLSLFSGQETNATTAFLSASAGLITSTTAITSIEAKPSLGNWMIGSSFYLYGIKNS